VLRRRRFRGNATAEGYVLMGLSDRTIAAWACSSPAPRALGGLGERLS
jgi:hypothetical protein